MSNINKRLIKLAKYNDLEESLKKQEIVRGVRKEMSTSDELAILRKAVAYLFELIAVLHEGEISNEEFASYNERVEEIKALIKTSMNS